MSAGGAGTLELHDRVISGPSWARPLRGIVRFARRKPLGFVGLVLVAIFIAAAIFAPLIAPYDYKQQQLRRRLEPPSRDHILGTDSIGRDVFSRLVYGARVSVTVGFGAVLITAVLASVIGIVSGYFGVRVQT
jgi:peptide/nickel transport system permease protein